MTSEAVSGGERRDPDVHAETETNQVPSETKTFKEGDTQQ